MSQQYLTIDEAAKYTHLNVSALRKSVADGSLVCFKPRNRKLLFTIAALDKFIQSSRIKIPEFQC